jgi:hypothetical protein
MGGWTPLRFTVNDHITLGFFFTGSIYSVPKARVWRWFKAL